jgi:pyrroloquinoline quinone (PQQ) biosynthesis protein C
LAAYDSVLHGSAAQALAGLFAYETQGAAIADSKADGLARHYGASGAALDFWHAHGSIEIDHAAWTLDALESLEPTLEEVASGTRIVADAWWAFLDERNELVAA